MNNQIQVVTPAPVTMVALTEGALSISDITRQYEIIVNAMRLVMKEGEHYGTIPGCGNKKTLLKPGAEVLLVLFGLTTDLEVTRYDLPNGHREYECKCTIFAPSGRRLATGVGSCSTMETKYRFRSGPTEITDTRVPKEYWDVRESDPIRAREILGGKGFIAKKGDDSKWYVAIQGERVEHDNPPDYYNTVLKIAQKRALVDGVLYSTAASFLFTQDLEEMMENGIIHPTEGGTSRTINSITATAESEDGEGSSGNKLPANPDQILVTLKRKQIKHTLNNEGAIVVKLNYSDTANRKFISELGFRWNTADKSWVYMP